MWLRLIVDVVILAMSVVSATSIVRALVPKKWLATKPFSCDVCMSFWPLAGVVLYVLLRHIDAALALAAIPAHGLAVLLLVRLRPLPELPDLIEDDK